MRKILVLLTVLFLIVGCTTGEQHKKETSNQENYQVDVVVIGAGGAGMAAALEVKNAGLDVVILEKMSYIGGNTVRSEGGLNATETDFQNKKGIEDTVELMVEDTLKGGKEINDKELVQYLAENSSNTIDWLTSIGMDMSDVGQGAGASKPRMHRPSDGSKIGGVLVPTLQAALDKADISVLTNTTVTKLLANDNNEVVGIIATNKNGKEITIHANAVVVATGGFGANEEMYTQYREDLKGFSTTNHPGATGDGIVLAQTIGAAVVDMKEIQTNPTVEVTTNTVISETVRGKGTIMVNQSGERFTSEMLTRDVLSSAILEQEGQVAYLIFDERVMNSMAALKANYEKGIIFKGETIEELASLINIDADSLEATLVEWNGFVKNQNDPTFNRETGMEEDLSQAPYYAVRVKPAVHYTMGGLKINTLTEVLTENNVPIKGLYAAGEVTGGVHGANRLGGNAVADIMVFGRQAGIQASSYASTLQKKTLVLPVEEISTTKAKGNYVDGTYEGIGKGREGDITVKVIVENSSITSIEIISNNETPGLYEAARDGIVEEIIKTQSIEVDTVTGATETSKGILAAVKDALK